MSSVALASSPLGLLASLERPLGPKAAPATQPGVAPRAFNRIQVDLARRQVTKWSSAAAGKLAQEIAFYEAVPPALRACFPTLLAHGSREGGRFYTMEYVEGDALSTRMVAPAAGAAFDFERAIGAIVDLHQTAFTAYRPGPLDAAALTAFYWDKTRERLAGVAKTNPRLAEWLDRDTLRLNGARRRGWPQLAPHIHAALARICAHAPGGFVHGDLCLSNILWCERRGAPVFIDPRGAFLGAVNWGDVRYDLAKLLHSSHGAYDLVTHDLFELAEGGDGALTLRFEAAAARRARGVAEATLRALRRHLTAAQLKDVLLLEALLFMSMLPLHYDAPKRQQAFACIGIELVNRWFEGTADAPLC